VSVPHEGHARFGGEVNERLPANVHRRAHDRPAGEGPGRLNWVVIGDWFRAIFADVEAFAGDGELARLGLDAPFPTSFSPAWRVRVPSAGIESPSRPNEAETTRWTR